MFPSDLEVGEKENYKGTAQLVVCFETRLLHFHKTPACLGSFSFFF